MNCSSLLKHYWLLTGTEYSKRISFTHGCDATYVEIDGSLLMYICGTK